MFDHNLHGEEHKIVDFLQKYPKAKMAYLKFLVYEKKSKVIYVIIVVVVIYPYITLQVAKRRRKIFHLTVAPCATCNNK